MRTIGPLYSTHYHRNQANERSPQMETPNWNQVLVFVKDQYATLRAGEYKHSHRSHAATAAMKAASEHFALDLTVEGHMLNDRSAGISYLNVGDPYIDTIVFDHNNEFTVTCYGDVVEAFEQEVCEDDHDSWTMLD
jgi:hypothetical protein